MKRFMICVSILAVVGLAACANNAPEGSATNTPAAATEQVLATAEPTVAPTPEPTTAPTPTPEPTAEPTPIVQQTGITAGVFDYLMTPEGRDPMYNFIHFYDIGVFYASLYGGSQYVAGFYEVSDEPREYETGADSEKFTANKTLTLKNVDGTDYAVFGYDEANDRVTDVTPLYNNEFTHNYEPDPAKTAEQGVTMSEYMLGDDVYSSVQLKHNGTFQDTVGMLIEGAWALDGNTYTFTEADGGKTYKMVVSDDKLTAEYTDSSGGKETLNLVRDAQLQLAFSGTAKHSSYGDVGVVIKCMDDGSATLEISVGGTAQEKPGGTWELAANKSSVGLNINDTDFSAPINMADYSFSFDFTMDVGGEVLVFPMTSSDTAVRTLTYTFTGEANDKVRLEMYSDGACELIYEGMGTITTGIWSVDASAGPLPKWTVELAETFEGQPVEVTTDYATKFSFTFKNASGRLEETLALSFADYQSAQN